MDIPIWALGLSTPTKARRATKWGGIACFIAAVRKLVGEAIFVVSAGKPLDHAIAWLAGASIIPIIIVVAGVQLLRGKGRASGCVAVLVIILDAITANFRTMTFQIIASMAVSVLLLCLIVNGVRAAFALRQVDYQRALRNTFE